MLHIRVVTAGALVLVMAGAAAAQSDDVSGATAPGKPISLLQLLLKPASSEPAKDETATPAAQTTSELQAQSEPRAHTRIAHRHKSAKKYAHRKAHDDTAKAESSSSDSAAATAAQAPDAAATAQTAPGQSNMSAVVVDGHTVPIAAPDQVNMMDMAAGDAQSVPQQAAAAPLQTTAAPQQAAAAPQQASIADPPPAMDPPQATDSQQPSVTLPAQPASTNEQPAATDQTPETAQPVVAMASMAKQDDGNDKSRDLWYEKLLMTLSGGFVAASVAWLLIGSAPPRRSEPMLTYETERMAGNRK